MSSVILGRHEVESWVPQPGPTLSNARLLAKLFLSISKAMVSMIRLPHVLQDQHYPQLRNELERLFLWGQGLSVSDGGLDEALAHARELRLQVTAVLRSLGTTIIQHILRNSPRSSPLESELCGDLRMVLDRADAILPKQETDQPVITCTPSDAGSSEYGAEEMIEEVRIYVDCLLDLSPALETPALDIQIEVSAALTKQIKEDFTVSSEEALMCCRNLRDHFEDLPRYLVERLAEANVLRARALSELRSRSSYHNSRLVDDIAEYCFPAADLTMATTKTKVSTAGPSSTATEVSREQTSTTVKFDDNVSPAGLAACFTAESRTPLGRLKVPPTPKIMHEGFVCPICLSHVIDVHTRKDWKRHVFDDLKPYVCTVEECKEAQTVFSHRETWAQHEASHHPPSSRSPQCCFCSTLYHSIGPAFEKHVTDHMQQVSLLVLPPSTDQNTNFDDSEDNDSPEIASPIKFGSLLPDMNVGEKGNEAGFADPGEEEAPMATEEIQTAMESLSASTREAAGSRLDMPVETEGDGNKIAQQQVIPPSVTHRVLRAFYAFHPSDTVLDSSVRLPLNQGDLIIVHSIHKTGWVDGTLLASGARGWIPFNYCEAYNPDEMKILLEALLHLWDLFGNIDGTNTEVFRNQDFNRNIVDGVRHLLEQTHCLTRVSDLAIRNEGVRRARKALISEVSLFTNAAKRLLEFPKGSQATTLDMATISNTRLIDTVDEPSDLIDEMILGSFKITYKGALFLDVVEDVRRGNVTSTEESLPGNLEMTRTTRTT